jgi:hypothetical protein
MDDLRTCLEGTPRRTLLAIARLQGLRPKASAPKAELVEQLHAALLNPDHLEVLLDRLDSGEREVMAALLGAGNQMPRRRFERRFGTIRPYKPWRDDLPRQPWREPKGAGERPFYLGLLYIRSGPGSRGLAQQAVGIAKDLALLLNTLAPPSPVNVSRATPLVPSEPGVRVKPPVDHGCRDIGALLALLHAQDVVPLHGRWLSPRSLDAWRSRCVHPEPTEAPRSELHTQRLRSLHFLAEAAGLVGLAGRYLKPTPRGWTWLAADHTMRFTVLWEAWHQNPALWARYRMPGHACSFILDVLLALIPQLALAAKDVSSRLRPTWLDLESFLAAAQQATPSIPAEWLDWTAEYRAKAMVEFITVFLSALGVVETAAEAGPSFRVTSLGAWLLGASEEPLWPEPKPIDLTLAPDGVSWLHIERPHFLKSLHRVGLELYATWDQGRYILTPASFNRARGRGGTLEALLATLEEAGGALPSHEVRAMLRRWDRSGARMTLNRSAVLECDDPAVLSRLCGRRRFRRYVVRTLSPRAVVLNDAHLPAAVRYLRREGHDPRVFLPTEEAAVPAGRTVEAFQLLAGRVYQGLARFIQLPSWYPSGVLDGLAAALPPAEAAAADVQAQGILDSVADALDGWTPHPSPEPGLDPEVTWPQIEAAIRQGKSLRITYWTAGRGALTHRKVSPYRLERRARACYLVAFCHQARAERVFRLDRIHDLQVVDAPELDSDLDADEDSLFDY